jgi:hypothetical protein
LDQKWTPFLVGKIVLYWIIAFFAKTGVIPWTKNDPFWPQKADLKRPKKGKNSLYSVYVGGSRAPPPFFFKAPFWPPCPQECHRDGFLTKKFDFAGFFLRKTFQSRNNQQTRFFYRAKRVQRLKKNSKSGFSGPNGWNDSKGLISFR